ncbi:MAG TPA: AraC family transcriptional regulator [Amycolatopsis sp.]|uniref:AraC family transcriptional regulator n=1 Tax=Amycolatopsis sp. TaxID=37632 RepID=UPI002B461AE3|nr:AraC family transcriptional regulator [Amycolatopsis sp.]HKS49826.1 AraC family transcriptional regulator [Amycolatopsis sp.]
MKLTAPSVSRQYLVQTDDLDRVREAVSSVLTTHRVGLLEASGLAAKFSATSIDKIILMRLEYGAAVRIDVDPPERPFHLIQWPLRGSAIVVSGRERTVATPDVASLPDPRRGCVMRLAPDCVKVALRVDADHLRRHLQSLIGRPVREPVTFELGMDLRTSRSRSWRAALDLLLAETRRTGGLLEHPLVSAQVESAILTGLLLAQRHNYTAALQAEQTPAAPRSVKRVLERIEANPEFPLTVEELAAGAGVSVRALQKSFHDAIGCSPMTYLREIRLNRARDALASADPAAGASVTDIALNWGFRHLGRFSVEYRRRFGESPSQTLRR